MGIAAHGVAGLGRQVGKPRLLAEVLPVGQFVVGRRRPAGPHLFCPLGRRVAGDGHLGLVHPVRVPARDRARGLPRGCPGPRPGPGPLRRRFVPGGRPVRPRPGQGLDALRSERPACRPAARRGCSRPAGPRAGHRPGPVRLRHPKAWPRWPVRRTPWLRCPIPSRPRRRVDASLRPIPFSPLRGLAWWPYGLPRPFPACLARRPAWPDRIGPRPWSRFPRPAGAGLGQVGRLLAGLGHLRLRIVLVAGMLVTVLLFALLLLARLLVSGRFIAVGVDRRPACPPDRLLVYLLLAFLRPGPFPRPCRLRLDAARPPPLSCPPGPRH